MKPLFDVAHWDGETSWLTLETIQTCIPEASADDMKVLVQQGRVKAGEHGFAFKPPCAGCYFCECPPYRSDRC